MRNTVAKKLLKEVYAAMKFSSIVSIADARKQPKFKAMYRRRKKNYTNGSLRRADKVAQTHLIPISPDVAS